MGAIVFLSLGAIHTGAVTFADFVTSPWIKSQILSQTLKLSSNSMLELYQKTSPGYFNLNGVKITGVSSFVWHSFLKTFVSGFVAYSTNLSFYSFDTAPFYFGKLKFLLIFYPLEVALTRVMFGLEEGKNYSGMIQGVYKILKTEGFLALYSGFGFALLEFVVYLMITYRFQKLMLNRKKKRDDGILYGVILADAMATVASYSIGTLKRRSMVSGLVGENSTVELASGFEGLYSGIEYKLLADLVKNLIVGTLKGGKLFFSVN